MVARIVSFEIFAVDLPFRRAVAHAAASRSVSGSVFLKCTTDTGVVGFGECLPRSYVTGENRDGTYTLLRDRILPRLVSMAFDSYDEVRVFLTECDGKAPPDWIDPTVVQQAAWCAVDLALLDTFGRVFGRSVLDVGSVTKDHQTSLRAGIGQSGDIRYSGVLVGGAPKTRQVKSCILFRLYGLRQVKMKVGWEGDVAAVRRTRSLLGRRTDLRVDANAAWTAAEAARTMRAMVPFGVRCFEQPVAANAIDEMAYLVRETGLTIMADESFSDRKSLRGLIEQKACAAVNVRISKCGGLMASLQRCREARQAGLIVQVGCQVGESSLLSAAQLALLTQTPEVTYAEGCFGRHLLGEDVAEPVLHFAYGGRPPRMPPGCGFGVRVDERRLRRWAVRSDIVTGGQVPGPRQQ